MRRVELGLTDNREKRFFSNRIGVQTINFSVYAYETHSYVSAVR